MKVSELQKIALENGCLDYKIEYVREGDEFAFSDGESPRYSDRVSYAFYSDLYNKMRKEEVVFVDRCYKIIYVAEVANYYHPKGFELDWKEYKESEYGNPQLHKEEKENSVDRWASDVGIGFGDEPRLALLKRPDPEEALSVYVWEEYNLLAEKSKFYYGMETIDKTDKILLDIIQSDLDCIYKVAGVGKCVGVFEMEYSELRKVIIKNINKKLSSRIKELEKHGVRL